MLACLDFPDDWAKWLVSFGIDRNFLEQQPPMACFTAAATRWVLGLFKNSEGGQLSHERKEKENGDASLKIIKANSELDDPVLCSRPMLK
jgi:hypothetical protein